MAKDNRKINRGITAMMTMEGKTKRDGSPLKRSVTFAAGMEDELASHFNNTQLKEMVKRGDLSGDWKSMKK